VNLATARSIATHGATGIAFAAMAQGGTFPVPVSLGFATLLVIGWAKGDRASKEVRTLLVVATGGIGLVLLFLALSAGLDGVIASGGFCAALSLNRILSRTGPGDDPSIYLAAFLMLTVGAALTGEVAYGVWFVAFSIAITVGLTLSYLAREANEANVSETVRRELLATSLVRWLVILSAGSLGMAVAFFVLFPRLNGQWLSRRGGTVGAPMVGFASTVELGGQGVLRDDPRPALRLRMPELQRRAQASGSSLPSHLDLLLRGQALDTFDGHRWSVAPRQHHRVPTSPPPGFAGNTAEIEVLPVADAALIFSPGLPQAARVQAWAVGTPIRLQSRGDDVTIEPRPPGLYRYQVWSAVDPSPASLAQRGSAYPNDVTALDLQLPDRLDPRIRELAREWTSRISDPASRAAAVLTHLRQDFEYTAALPGEVADPLAHFLFERRKGHCEYFSTAMAVLLRTLGIPAREVTGFSGAILAPGDDYYLVRAGSAHSWVEVYFPDVGWAPFDPTPSTYLATEPNSVRAYVAAALDVVERRWQSAVVDYNLTSQFALATQAAAIARSVWGRFQRDPGQPDALPWRWGIGALAIGLIVWFVRRFPGRAPSETAAQAHAQQAYHALLGKLRRRGLVRTSGETPREFAERLARQHRPEANLVWEMTRLHEQALYRAQPWSRSETERAGQILRTLPRASS
jgi:transglutaminase-like putative cysteine protease